MIAKEIVSSKIEVEKFDLALQEFSSSSLGDIASVQSDTAH